MFYLLHPDLTKTFFETADEAIAAWQSGDVLMAIVPDDEG
jgi:hypothetical protein